MRGTKSDGSSPETPDSDASSGSALERLSAWQLVVLAVARCGGAMKSVDTEDVAIAVHGLAPGRFSWRKHQDQINLEHVRVALSDAKKPKCGALLTGSGDAGWMLSAAGKAFVDSQPQRSSATAVASRLSTEEKRLRSRELARIREHPVIQACIADSTHSPSVRDAELVFRIDSYVVGIDRRRKIDRLINMLGDDERLGSVVRRLGAVLLESEEGG